MGLFAEGLVAVMTVAEASQSESHVAPAFGRSYAQLPERFYSTAEPAPVSAPQPIFLNEALAREIGADVDWLASDDGLQMLSGNRFPAAARPVALAYAGHQFGTFVPQLGDGRALLVGELVDAAGNLRDVQLKGSGPTRFSRNGDGRAALGPVLRECIVSEAMAALQIPTTRTLAAVLTGDPVYRERRLQGAILTRVAASHIRIGTFQYFAVRGDADGLKILADYAIERHYPDAARSGAPYEALLRGVVGAQAELIARWMLVGFIHGVMNTDNMAISGETIDYGPCAFMEGYDPRAVFSSIDANGRYAYGNQPHIAVWNLARFAETLLPLLHDEESEAIRIAESVLDEFRTRYEAVFHRGLRRKVGLLSADAGDVALVGDLLGMMARQNADFTQTFRGLADATGGGTGTIPSPLADQAELGGWLQRWRTRLAREDGGQASARATMLAANPKYIPRNHRIEAVIEAANDERDFAPFRELLAVVMQPFSEQPEHAAYAVPAREDERVLRTFCGT